MCLQENAVPDCERFFNEDISTFAKQHKEGLVVFSSLAPCARSHRNRSNQYRVVDKARKRLSLN